MRKTKTMKGEERREKGEGEMKGGKEKSAKKRVADFKLKN